MKSAAVVKFHAESFQDEKKLLKHFKKTIKGIPDFVFKMAYVNGIDSKEPNVYLTLFCQNGFILPIYGLKPGSENSHLMIALLKFCGFEVDDETYLTITNHTDIRLLLWNKELFANSEA